ncbi:MAG: ABC-type transport auxiliary lipoprotein family protein [Salinisphaera sp.]|jgi:cholesterol transport system auxiliary component|nr:ABC-type transport auxiliary lipoprotein family protein [Salinisphaera sp.]
MNTPLLKFILPLLVGAGLLSACSVLPAHKTPQKAYDLGTLSHAPPAKFVVPANVEIGNIESTPWLQGSNIYYRFVFTDATRLRRYTRSRWLTPPATLLGERLRAVMSTPDRTKSSKSATLRLNLHVERFEQVFTTPERSHALLQVDASLTSQDSDDTIAEQEFRLRKPSQSADAQGAVNALASASNEFIQQLSQWLRKVDPQADAG